MNLRRRGLLLGAAAVLLLPTAPSAQQRQVAPPPRPAQTRPAGPRLEPMAETRLLMEGMADSNFRGIERLLQRKPADLASWRFLRGQALLIAETGNLLMIRPPHNSGETIWLQRASDMRSIAGQLARAAAASDYDRCRSVLGELAQSCNRCHQSFRVATRIVPFEPPERKVSAPWTAPRPDTSFLIDSR
jgi:hypothetical protein